METPQASTPAAPLVADTSALAKANMANANKPVVVASEQQPCNWELSWEDDTLVGTNIITGREFRGSKEDFRELMKG